MSMSDAKIQALRDEYDINTGDRLVECVRDGLIDLDMAFAINIALPSREKVFPPNLEAAADAAFAARARRLGGTP